MENRRPLTAEQLALLHAFNTAEQLALQDRSGEPLLHLAETHKEIPAYQAMVRMAGVFDRHFGPLNGNDVSAVELMESRVPVVEAFRGPDETLPDKIIY